MCYSPSCCTICTRTGWAARLWCSELRKFHIPERGLIAAHHFIRQHGKRRLWSETAIPDPIDREDATPPNEPSYYLPFIKRDLQPWADLGGITKVGTPAWGSWEPAWTAAAVLSAGGLPGAAATADRVITPTAVPRSPTRHGQQHANPFETPLPLSSRQAAVADRPLMDLLFRSHVTKPHSEAAFRSHAYAVDSGAATSSCPYLLRALVTSMGGEGDPGHSAGHRRMCVMLRGWPARADTVRGTSCASRLCADACGWTSRRTAATRGGTLPG